MTTETEFDAVKFLRGMSAHGSDFVTVNKSSLKQCATELESAKDQAAVAEAENLRLRMFLDQLARLGNEPLLGSSTGNRIAQAALAQQPSRAALDAYVAERVKGVEEEVKAAEKRAFHNYKQLVETQTLLQAAEARIKELEDEVDRQKGYCSYFRDELAKHAQTIGVFNKLPFYKRLFRSHITPKCQFDKGFNCCCGKHEREVGK